MRHIRVESCDGGALVSIEEFGDIHTSVDASLLPLDGAELSEEDTERLITSFLQPALDFGAKMLGMRLMTRGLLEKRMLDEGFDEPLVERALERFESLGALDDEEYARLFAADRKTRGWGEIRIRSELRRRFVDDDTVDAVIGELGDPAGEIEGFIIRKTGGRRVPRRDADKIGAALARKGFRWEDIRPVLREYTSDSYDSYD